MPKLFISSTYLDLIAERIKAISLVDRLDGYQAIAMEKFFAANHQSEQVCLHHLNPCDGLILILGDRYGSLSAGGQCSITEMEYNTAKLLNRPVFIFIKNDGTSAWKTSETDPARKQKHEDFLKRVENEKFRRTFKNPDELATEILGSIYEHEKHFGKLATGLSAFVDSKEFFKPWENPDQLFTHTLPFIGRLDLIQKISGFTKSKSGYAVLFGRGGSGKSKVLYEYAKKKGAYRILFARDGVTLTKEAAQELPSVPTLVIVDDAHRRDDLGVLLAITRSKPNVKLLLSSRPHGRGRILSVGQQQGFSSAQYTDLGEIANLTNKEVVALAEKVLGSKFKSYARQLAQITQDCPLVTVVGGKLLRNELINPLLLAHHDNFRTVVLSRFEEEITNVSSLIEPAFCRNLLRLIAATSPIRPLDANYRKTVIKFLSCSEAQLIDALGILESTGILLRRGNTLRITPDVLSDHILHIACCGENGSNTGYAKMIYDAFNEALPENVLVNLAELDWRLQSKSNSNRIDLLADIWSKIETEIKAAPASGRCAALKILEKIAFYQPQRCLEIVKYVMSHPSKAKERSAMPKELRIFYAQDRIEQYVAPVLKQIAYHPGHLIEAADLLWLLGRNDSRATHNNTEHAFRILEDIAKYELRKPLLVHEKIVFLVDKWLKDKSLNHYKQSPLKLIKLLFKKTGENNHSDEDTFYMGAFPVSYERTKKMRTDALDVVKKCLNEKNIKLCLEAIEILNSAIGPPEGLFGHIVSKKEEEQWRPEQSAIFSILKKFIKTVKNPIVLAVLEKTLTRWQRRRKKSDFIESNLDQCLKLIKPSYDLSVVKALMDLFHSDNPFQDYGKRIAEGKRRNSEVAKAVLAKYKTPRALVRNLTQISFEIAEAGLQLNPNGLLDQILIIRPNFCLPMATEIAKSPESNLNFALDSVLSSAFQTKPKQVRDWIKKLGLRGHFKACLSIANGYSRRRWSVPLHLDDLKILFILVKNSDSSVAKLSIDAFRHLGPTTLKKGVAFLISNSQLYKDSNTADTVFGIFEKNWGISPDSIPHKELMKLTARLVEIPELGDRYYAIDRFLVFLKEKHPLLFVDTFLKRIERGRKKPRDYRYHPIGFSEFREAFTGISKMKGYARVMRRIRNLTLKERFRDRLTQLFAHLSENFGQESMEVLHEWVISKNAKKIDCVTDLIGEAEPDFVFTHEEFVIDLIAASSQISNEKVSNAVHSALFSIAVMGERSGKPGEPFPQDIALEKKAAEMCEKHKSNSEVSRFYNSLVDEARKNMKERELRIADR